MEIIQAPSSMESSSREAGKKTRVCASGCGRFVALLIVAAVFGFAGGLLSPVVVNKYFKQTPVGEKNIAPRESAESAVVTEDKTVTDLVEKNSPGVVSIVISRDVPKVRNFYGNPFGGSFPFFFDPFNAEDQGSGSADSGKTEKQKIGSGSGFFISEDGLIVTNKHVVADEQADYTVILSGGKEYPAKVLARDPSNDIAVLKIEGSPRGVSGEAGDSFPALTIGDSDQIKVGQTVIAIGNPLGEFANSVTQGIVSGLKRSVSAGSGMGEREEQLTDVIQMDAAINPGNSGGPLFNLSGAVIGVNVAMAQGAENIGFALPINQVKRIVEQVRTTGKISVPYIGVCYIILDDTAQKENNLPYNYGALILRGQRMTDFAVIPGSPADKAGLVENDIILEINGTKIDDAHPLSNLISQYNVGDEITLKVSHKGVTKDVKVKLEERK